MRILFAIPHFVNPQGDRRYSSGAPNVQPRIQGLTNCVAALHQLFGGKHYLLDIARRMALPANQSQRHELDLAVLTTGDKHILDQVKLPPRLFRHVPVDCEPMQLEFECQAVLREGLANNYDYYCFLEDDLILHDPQFFQKLKWFNGNVGDDKLLQPRRYEVAMHGPVHKLFLDGAIRPDLTARWQNVKEEAEIRGKVLDQPIRFVRPLNPHAGCYFLNQRQMAHWVAQPHFLDRDVSFIGPLESAATLGIMKTFKIYKPAPENADFLQVQHYDYKHVGSVGKSIPVVERE